MHPLTRRYFFDGSNSKVEDPATGFARAYELAPGGMVAGAGDTEKRILPFILQAEHTMRNGDIVRVGPNEKGAGQNIANFAASPSIFVNHDSWTPAVARAENIAQNLDAKPFPTTTADFHFHTDPLNERAQLYWVLYRDKIQNAVSTGIWVMGWEAIREEGQEGIPDCWLPWDCWASELMETSLVGLPNDPLALAQNGVQAAASDLLSRVANSAGLASQKDGMAHAKEVARYLVNAFGRDAFAELLPPPAPKPDADAPRILSLESVAPPAPARAPRTLTEHELDLIAFETIATL